MTASVPPSPPHPRNIPAAPTGPNMAERDWESSRYISAMDPEDLPRKMAAVHLVVEQWKRNGEITASDRVVASYGLGLVAAALAESVADEQVAAAINMMEAMIGIQDAIAAIGALADWYAVVSERRPDLFRKPFRRGIRGGNLPADLPADVAAKRRVASDDEVTEFVAETATAFRALAEAMRHASEAAGTANRMCDRFYPPDSEWPLEPIPVPTALYFWYDADRVLLYIGITGDLATRQSSHAKRSSWAEFADHSKVRRFLSRSEAEAAEKAAIESDRPLFNRTYNDTPEARQRLVAYLVKQNRLDLLTPAVQRG